MAQFEIFNLLVFTVTKIERYLTTQREGERERKRELYNHGEVSGLMSAVCEGMANSANKHPVMADSDSQ